MIAAVPNPLRLSSLVLWLALAATLGSCALFTRGTTHDAAREADALDDQVWGSLDGFESVVFTVDPVNGGDPDARIAWALELARAATIESYDADEALDTVPRVTPRLSPTRAAMYRIDEAVNLASIAALPSPQGSPLSIEERRRADDRNVQPGHLRIYVPRSRERYDIQLYDETGRMRLAGVIEASHAMRDHHSQITKSIDPRLLAMLYFVGQYFDAELHLLSGYRVRGVNASRGSRHGSGEAADIRIPGVSIHTIAAYVESTFANLGMGVYPTSGFTHIDTRARTFYWQDRSGPGQRSRTRARGITRRGTAETDPTLRSIHMTEREVFAWPRRDAD